MRAVVLGSWGIGESVLRSAIETPGVDVVAVFTRSRVENSPDPFRNLVADLAQSANVPQYPPSATAGSGGAALLETLAPDVILSAAHPTLLAPDFLAVPRFGALNLHGSLLPRHRGTSPVNWTLIRDEPETGLTMHYIDEGMDTGDVVYREVVQVVDTDTPGTLSDKIKALAPQLIHRALVELVEGRSLPRVRQNEEEATYAPRLKGDDLRVNWNQAARAVWSFIRGTSQPGLGARSQSGSSALTIWGSTIESIPAPPGATPGTITRADAQSVDVACAEGTIRIPLSSVQVSGDSMKFRTGTLLESRPQ